MDQQHEKREARDVFARSSHWLWSLYAMRLQAKGVLPSVITIVS